MIASQYLQEGLEFILNKVRQGVVLPRGAAYIVSDEGASGSFLAVVGWGSEVVAVDSKHPQLAIATDLARRIAVQESQASLVRALSGESIAALDRTQHINRDVTGGGSLDRPSIPESAQPLPQDMAPNRPNFRSEPEKKPEAAASPAQLVQTRHAGSVEIVAEGVLPPGTINRWYVQDGWAYAVCIYPFAPAAPKPGERKPDSTK